MIGGLGGNVIPSLGPGPEKDDKELSPAALQLRKFRRAMGVGGRRPIAVLKGQLSLFWRETK